LDAPQITIHKAAAIRRFLLSLMEKITSSALDGLIGEGGIKIVATPYVGWCIFPWGENTYKIEGGRNHPLYT
jgi:hypothetical protein